MRTRTVALSLSLTLIVGCAGNGEGLDDNGRPTEEGEGGGLSADFDSIQSNVLTPICTTCHSGAAAPLGLRLDEGASYALLVNAPSTEVPGLLRVNPGDPDSSYLIQKIEGTAEVGGRMPLGGSPLPAETIALIRQWILEGAQAPQSSGVSPSKLSAAWPIEGTLSRNAPAIVIASERELDTSLLQAGTLTITRSGGDADFANGNEVQIDAQIELRSLSPTVLAITPPPGGWTADAYRLRVSGSSPLAVTDLNSVAIDGNADGQAGGDFELNFSVEESK